MHFFISQLGTCTLVEVPAAVDDTLRFVCKVGEETWGHIESAVRAAWALEQCQSCLAHGATEAQTYLVDDGRLCGLALVGDLNGLVAV